VKYAEKEGIGTWNMGEWWEGEGRVREVEKTYSMIFQARTDVWGRPPPNLRESWMSAVWALCIMSLKVGGLLDDWLELLVDVVVELDGPLKLGCWKSFGVLLVALRTMMLGMGGCTAVSAVDVSPSACGPAVS
jgi:hypothetical protein